MIPLFTNFCDLPWWLYWLVPFLLGILLGYLIWSKYKRIVEDLKQEAEKLHITITDLKEELNDNRSKQSELVGEIALLKGRIREMEQDQEESKPEARVTEIEQALKEERSAKAELKGQIALLKGTIAELKAEAEKSGTQHLSEASIEAGGEEAVKAQKQISKLEKDLEDSRKKRTDLEGEIALLKGKIAEIQQEDSAKAKLKAKESAKKKASGKSATSDKGDDLKIIEGIGPKIENLLNANGIHTFLDLSKEAVTRLEAILEKGGTRYRLAKPGTWPVQAKMAAEGRFEELEAYQNVLKGGA